MELKIFQRIMMAVIVAVIALGASYSIITADKFDQKTGAVLVMAHIG